MRLLTLCLVISIGCAAARSTEGPRRAFVSLEGMDISGKLMIEQASKTSPVKIRGIIYGLEPGRHALHIHAGSSLGRQCESVGSKWVPAKSESERPAGFLGNVKSFSGEPSRTDINLISSLVSLYEENTRSILNRALVIHALPEDRTTSVNEQNENDNLLACGLIRFAEIEQESSERDQILIGMEKPYPVDKIEQSIFDGEQTWENVRHPHFGDSEGRRDREREQREPSNLNLEGVQRPEIRVDSLSLETAVPTRKVWMSGYTYEYDYAGWTSTGIVGISSKVTGGSIKGKLVIEPVDESTLNIALLSTKAKQFHEDVMDKYSTVDPGQEVRIIDQEHLEKPFQVKITAGKVESVAISKESPLWIVNFKRALASQIQVQLDSSSGVFHKDEYDNYYAENTAYHTVEGSVSGECDTWYSISRLPTEAIEAEPELLPAPELCESSFPVYEIVKNRDFDKCRILPYYQYNSNSGLDCDLINGAGCENKFSHVENTRIIGCTSDKGHFIVQRINSVDKLVTKPFSYETEATEGLTIQYFNLRSATPTGASKLVSRISPDSHSYQTLAYSYDDDYKTHGPLMGKPSLRSVNSPMVMEVETEVLKKEAQRLWSEIVAQLDGENYYYEPSEEKVADKINMLRRVFSSFDWPELNAFVNQVWENKEWSTSNQVVADTLMLSGTNPSLLVVRDLILKGKITGEWAVQIISTLVPTIETPTKELLTSFYEFLKSDVVMGHQQLKITTALSLSRLVYQACVNTTQSLNMFPKLVMGEFCSPSDSIVSSMLVPFLVEQIKTAPDAGERMAFLTALGNIGHEMIIPHIKPYIASCEPSSHYETEWYKNNERDLVNLSKKDMRKKWIEAKKSFSKKQIEAALEQDKIWSKRAFVETAEDWEDEALCNIIRTKAIFALTNLAEQQEEVVASLLMPIYFNKAEETEVRLAALTLLFVYDPPQSFWNRVALSTWYEPNDQISHFIYTTIASKVANKDSVDREDTLKAEAALPLMKPFFWTSYVSMNYHKAGFEEKTRLGYVFNTVNFPGYESFIPSHHYNSLSARVGPWFTKLVDWSIDSRHAEKFIDRLFGKPGMRLNNKDESSITSPELEKITEDLKIEARATGQPELYIYLNFLDNYQRFYTINTTTVYSVIQKQLIQKGFRDNSGKLEVNYHKYVPMLDTFTRIPSAMGLAYSWVNHHSVFVSVKSRVEGGWNWAAFSGKLEGSLMPVAVARMTSRLFVETPFTRSYPTTGVDMEIAIALPGKFSVEAEYKTGKIQTAWEIPNRKFKIAKYKVIPFTTIRKINDFTPASLIAETKKISMAEKLQERKWNFGEKALGLNLELHQKGDAQALNQPWPYHNDILGSVFFFAKPTTLRRREITLWLDGAASETMYFKSFWTLSAKSDSKFDTPLTGHLHAKALLDTVWGDKIKTGKQQWVKETEQEWHSQKYQQIFKSLTNPTGYSVDFAFELTGKSGSIKPRHIASSLAYGMDDKTHRASLMMEKRSEQSSETNFVFCAEFDGQFPDNLVFKRKELIKDDADRSSIFKFGFGKSCTDDRKVTISTKWTRSEDEVTPSIRAKWQEAQCQKQEKVGRGLSDECVAAHRLNAFLNKAVVTVEYTEMPAFVKNVTVKATNFLRHFWAPYMSDNEVDVNNPANKVTIESVYWPLSGAFDFKLYKPHSNTFYHGVQVHPIAEVFLPKRMAMPRSVLAAPGVCLIGSETVTTFDGLFYNATLSGCDQVLTKDCSNRYKFAVLSREENNKKIVTVLLNSEKIEVFPAQQKVKVNGMDVAVSSASYVLKNAENEILAVIKKTTDNFVEVDSTMSHMIRVLSDGNEVVVLGSPIHRGRLCGLCGSQTGNKMTDLTGPRECIIPRDLLDVAWELKTPAGCKSDISSSDLSELRRVQESCLKEESENVFGISDVTPLLPKFQQQLVSNKRMRSPSQWTVFRNKMIVQDGKRCFSTDSVAKCAEGSQPAATEERKLGFHCIPKNSLSEQLYEDMNTRPLNELMGKEIEIVRTYTVPTTCVPF